MREIDSLFLAKEINALTICKARAVNRRLFVRFPDGWNEYTYSISRAWYLLRLAGREGIR